MIWERARKEGFYYEVVWSDTEEYLRRFGGHKELHNYLYQAENAFLRLGYRPYKQINKIECDDCGRPLSDELIKSENIYNW